MSNYVYVRPLVTDYGYCITPRPTLHCAISECPALPCLALHCPSPRTPCPAPRRAAPPCPALRCPAHALPCPALRCPAHPLPCPASRCPTPALPYPASCCSPRPAALHVAPCCSPRVVPCCPARRALRQPACCALLPRASRSVAARASRPVTPRVAPYGSPRVALCCPARRAMLHPARRALLPCASRPTAARASRPAALHCAHPAAHAAQAEPSRLALPDPPYYSYYCCCYWRCCSLASPSRSAALTTSAATRATAFTPYCPRGRAPPSLPAMTSLRSSGGSGDGGGGRSGSGGGRSSSHYGTVRCRVSGGGQMQLQQHPTLTPQQLREWFYQRGVCSLRSLPPLPALPAPPCLPCVEGRHCAAPQSSSFPPIEAPLQTLHLDLWGTTRVRGQGAERYFLPVVDDYSRYTTVFPLRTKGEVPAVLIPWIRAVHLQLRWRFRTDLLVLCVHYDRGGAFTSDLLRAFCQGEGIEESFMLPGSPQQNGVAESHIGLVMEIARTSLIHAAAPQFLWPFAVRYAEQQLNLWPRVSLPETSPTLRWMGEVGDASRFRVRGARALVRDTSVDKLSSRTIPCVFLGFVPDMPGWQFYHPTSHRVFPSQDVTFDKSVPFYCLFPYRTAPLPPPPLFLTPGPPSIDPLPPQGPAPSGVSHVDPLPLAKPLEVTSNTSSPAEGDDVTADAPVAYHHTPRLETPPGFPPRPSSPPLQPVAVDSSAAGGGATRGAASRGAEPVREVLGGVEPEGAVPEGARLGGVESANVPPGLVSKRGPLSPQ
ncbi:unnamed protein product [Closterium sp. NIES-54]